MNIIMKNMSIITKNMSIITKSTDTIIITITKGAKWKNTASVLSFTTAVRHSTFTNSTISSPPDGAATSSVPKAYAISATTATCPTFFEQAGTQKQLTEAGLWYATAPEEDLIELMRQEPGLMRDWDEKYGDRMQKIVFIGQHMDKEQIIRDLDECLE